MLHKACWAISLAFLVCPFAAAQTPGTTEPIPAPKYASTEPAASAGPLSDMAPLLSLQTLRPLPRVFVETDYLMWWVHRGPSPTLVTTAPNNGYPSSTMPGGPIGGQGTTAVFDDRNLDYGTVSGMRLNLGINLDSDGFWGLEANGFFLPKKSIDLSAAGNTAGVPLLTIPYLDAATARQSSLTVSAQDGAGNPFISGSVGIHSDLEVWSYEFNAVAHSVRSEGRFIDLLFGFRALGLDENLNINQNITAQQTGAITMQYPTVGQGIADYYNVPQGGTVVVLDSFSTHNRFYGVQFGGRFGWDFGRWDVELTGKVAVGVTLEQVSISGSTAANALQNATTGAALPGANFITAGGTFALPTNIGNYSQSQFSVVPELGLNVNYAVTSWLQLQVGYSGMYWSNVVRPGAQIDTTLNSKLIPTGGFTPTKQTPNGNFDGSQEEARPTFTFHDTAFWAQGVHFGLQFRY